MFGAGLKLEIPTKLRKSLEKEAKDAKISLNAHIIKKLEGITPAIEYIDRSVIEKNIEYLVSYLNKIPSIDVISHEVSPDAYWWVKLDINLSHEFAWHTVQELGFVLNYISLQEPMPTIFKPVSPPPYLNGGPHEYLSWVIESTYNYIDPKWVADTLEGRLPQPVDDLSQWKDDE